MIAPPVSWPATQSATATSAAAYSPGTDAATPSAEAATAVALPANSSASTAAIVDRSSRALLVRFLFIRLSVMSPFVYSEGLGIRDCRVIPAAALKG